jgi:YVTN family beta-propeller protein
LSGTVTVIDTGDDRVLATIGTGGKPWGVVAAP